MSTVRESNSRPRLTRASCYHYHQLCVCQFSFKPVKLTKTPTITIRWKYASVPANLIAVVRGLLGYVVCVQTVNVAVARFELDQRVMSPRCYHYTTPQYHLNRIIIGGSVKHYIVRIHKYVLIFPVLQE